MSSTPRSPENDPSTAQSLTRDDSDLNSPRQVLTEKMAQLEVTALDKAYTDTQDFVTNADLLWVLKVLDTVKDDLDAKAGYASKLFKSMSSHEKKIFTNLMTQINELKNTFNPDLAYLAENDYNRMDQSLYALFHTICQRVNKALSEICLHAGELSCNSYIEILNASANEDKSSKCDEHFIARSLAMISRVAISSYGLSSYETPSERIIFPENKTYHAVSVLANEVPVDKMYAKYGMEIKR